MSFDIIQIGDMKFSIENIDFLSAKVNDKSGKNKNMCECLLLYTGESSSYKEIKIPDILPEQKSSILPLIYFIDSKEKIANFIFPLNEITQMDGYGDLIEMRVLVSFNVPPDLPYTFHETIFNRPKFSEYKARRIMESRIPEKSSFLDFS